MSNKNVTPRILPIHKDIVLIKYGQQVEPVYMNDNVYYIGPKTKKLKFCDFTFSSEPMDFSLSYPFVAGIVANGSKNEIEIKNLYGSRDEQQREKQPSTKDFKITDFPAVKFICATNERFYVASGSVIQCIIPPSIEALSKAMTQDLLQKHAQNLMIVTGLGSNIQQLQIESSFANLYVGNFRDGFREFIDAREQTTSKKDKEEKTSDARRVLSLFMEGKIGVKENGEIEEGIDYLKHKKSLVSEKLLGNFKQGTNTIPSKCKKNK
jgi:hypothetical protein